MGERGRGGGRTRGDGVAEGERASECNGRLGEGEEEGRARAHAVTVFSPLGSQPPCPCLERGVRIAVADERGVKAAVELHLLVGRQILRPILPQMLMQPLVEGGHEGNVVLSRFKPVPLGGHEGVAVLLILVFLEAELRGDQPRRARGRDEPPRRLQPMVDRDVEWVHGRCVARKDPTIRFPHK